MNIGELKKGLRVYFTQEGVDPLIKVTSGEVAAIIFPGTTNEYAVVTQIDIMSGDKITIQVKSPNCFLTQEEARKYALIKLHEELGFLSAKMSCLGDHSLAASRWKRN